jgi:hypothetical protein
MPFAISSPSGSLEGGRVMMKIAASLLFASALVVWTANAQNPPDLQRSAKTDSPEAPAAVIAPLGVGTAFNASLDDTLDTRKTKAGALVTAETSEDVTYQRCLIFPKGTKIVGHVVRVTAGGRGRGGSAIFIQFDKASVKDGQDVILNAGIQALAVGTVAPMPPGRPKDGATSAQAVPMVQDSAGSAESSDALVVSTLYQEPRSTPRPPLLRGLAPEGELNSDGLFTADSKGAFGRPDLKIYTPTSEGSRGSVLVSSRKNMHLDAGTHLLLVVQPPSNRDAETSGSSPTDLDPQ